ELPAAQRAELGQKVAVGQVEVQPVRIVKRRLEILQESARDAEQQRTHTKDPALVMTLLIKNTGDVPIFPMDPAFTRREGRGDRQIARVVVGKQVFAGGHIEWPLDPNRLKKKIEVQQGNDAIPLRPNESREYVVFTEAKSDIVTAVESSKDRIQWRVQVRRG